MRRLGQSLLPLLAFVMAAASFTALADGGPECAVDPDTGIPFVESGACFGDFGYSLGIFDEADLEFIAAFGGPADNQWFRLNPNGRGFFHAALEDGFMVYCSTETILADECRPGFPGPYSGFGKVMVNTRAQDGFFTCPLTARVRGRVMNGFGDEVELAGKLTLVPDSDLGCRATLGEVEAFPVDD